MTRKWLKASATEHSPSASNYHGKLLGAIMSLLILRTASSTLLLPYPPIVLYCNNCGVIDHNNSPLVSLPKKQCQADLIHCIKHFAGTSLSKPSWEWVEGHAVEQKRKRFRSLPERMNNQANTLTKKSLLHAISGGGVLQGNFPFELVKIKVSSNWVSGSPHQAIERDWGHHAAQSLFSDKDIICKEEFHLVWWDGLGATMATYPKCTRFG
jgi:hypothetical protein